MSDLGFDDAGGQGRLLAPATVAVLLAVGITSFVAMLLLGAYAPELGGGGGGGHALSDAVNGFGGVVRLAEATGRHPRVVRAAALLDTDDLVVATLEAGSVPIGPVIEGRAAKPTLLVLPKWSTTPDATHRGWSWIAGLKQPADPAAVTAPAAHLNVVQRRSGGRPLRTVSPMLRGVTFAAPRPLQAVRPSRAAPVDHGGGHLYGRFEPLIVDENGNIVLGRFADRPLFVLADPDLLDNRGMHDARTAAAALAMLDRIGDTGAGSGAIAFDVTLNGLAQRATPLKLLFMPPFLAGTLTLVVAALLAALGTVTRFGSASPRERAIAFGKAALVDNTAALVRKAGRETRLGSRYVAVVREAAARAVGAPARLRGDALDGYLDRVAPDRRFTALAGAVSRASDETELVTAARALHDWMGERNR